mmetsp:Transcript_7672/g.20346  ORF Transcript_7672/g.20346 Transcript_7672/m.20346 type:complete len:223 (+) Transcript_7672:995-1663(+)
MGERVHEAGVVEEDDLVQVILPLLGVVRGAREELLVVSQEVRLGERAEVPQLALARALLPHGLELELLGQPRAVGPNLLDRLRDLLEVRLVAGRAAEELQRELLEPRRVRRRVRVPLGLAALVPVPVGLGGQRLQALADQERPCDVGGGVQYVQDAVVLGLVDIPEQRRALAFDGHDGQLPANSRHPLEPAAAGWAASRTARRQNFRECIQSLMRLACDTYD